jgi:signal transduction histidine kinase
MRVPRALLAAVTAACGVFGALTAVGVARVAEPERVPVNELAVALTVTTYAAVALLVGVARPGHRVGRLMLLGVTAWGAGEGLLAAGLHGYLHEPGSISGAAWYAVLGTAARALGWLVLVVAVPLFFPDGRPPWRDRRAPSAIVAAGVALFTTSTLLAPRPLDTRLQGMDSPTGLPDAMRPVADLVALGALALCAVALVVSITGLVHRWRAGDQLRHQQLLWLGLAFALPVLFVPVIATPVAAPWMFAVVTLPVPMAVAVAILQRRLYDVQLAATRTLTYLGLSAVVTALYVATVAGVGAVMDERGAVWLPWLAAGVVAVSFTPLRNTLQEGVNRITYGQWSQPAEVLGATARRLADATDVPALLELLVVELGESLRLGRVEIRDREDRLLAAHGRVGPPLEDTLLSAYGVPVGMLRWSSDQPLREADRRLLHDVTHQLGAAVHAAALVRTLRVAQHRLVIAREEERRRLRRDLHDGLGPALASLTLRVDVLRNTWPDLDDPDADLVELRSAIQATVSDVRRIVEGLRPAPLDELGLVGALEQLAARTVAGDDVAIDVVVGPLPPLAAAVEVAVFRVVQEALTNVQRHSGAARVTVEATVTGDLLRVEVRDDGAGTVHPRPGGVGLVSMRERAAELGGSLDTESRRGHGTVVRLQLPLGGQPSPRTAPA